ncbi:MAG: DUF1311 domain-containing protein [Synergistaceae bacterium]|nr:DUF1311 domain-containing protein [Synergistaceae bacterium]
MKRLLTFIVLVVMCVPAFALSDAEYIRLKKSSTDFARADKRLSNVWTNVKKSLPKKIFTELQKVQREWIASGRDEAADEYVEQGYSRAEAYTMATNDRADALPQIAADLRSGISTSSRPSRPAKRPEPEPEEEPEPEPEPEPRKKPAARPRIPDPVPEPEPEPEEDSQPVGDVSGEYKSNSGFMFVRVIDQSTQEVEVTVSRWKDEVNWKSRGWIEDNVLELSDANYSRCVATIKFSRGKAVIEVSDTEDWAEATAEDFVIAGTYTKD